MLGITVAVKASSVIAVNLRSEHDPCNAPYGALCTHDAESIVQPCCQQSHVLSKLTGDCNEQKIKIFLSALTETYSLLAVQQSQTRAHSGVVQSHTKVQQEHHSSKLCLTDGQQNVLRNRRHGHDYPG